MKAPLHTKTGRPLTDADLDRLADEAERGYDVSKMLDTSSSASRQHFIDTGRYLTAAEVAEQAEVDES